MKKILYLYIIILSIQPIYGLSYDPVPDEELPFTTKFITRKKYDIKGRSGFDFKFITENGAKTEKISIDTEEAPPIIVVRETHQNTSMPVKKESPSEEGQAEHNEIRD